MDETGGVSEKYEERESFRFRSAAFLRSLEGLSPDEVREEEKEELAGNNELGRGFLGFCVVRGVIG